TGDGTGGVGDNDVVIGQIGYSLIRQRDGEIGQRSARDIRHDAGIAAVRSPLIGCRSEAAGAGRNFSEVDRASGGFGAVGSDRRGGGGRRTKRGLGWGGGRRTRLVIKRKPPRPLTGIEKKQPGEPWRVGFLGGMAPAVPKLSSLKPVPPLAVVGRVKVQA